MAGSDPDWEEIAARSKRLFDDALSEGSIAHAPYAEIAGAMIDMAKEEAEHVAALQLLLRGMPPSPAMSHGVGLRARRCQLLVVGHGHFAAMAREEPVFRLLIAGRSG